MPLIDTHAHLDEDSFSQDRDEIVQRFLQEDVVAVISIGTTAQSSRQTIEIARQYPSVYAAVGIQPNYTAEAQPGDWETIESLASEEKVVAVGETGLDRYWDFAPIDLQRDYFTSHIELSRRLDLPFIVHCRESEADVVQQLQQESQDGPLKGVMHSFCGDWETARACLDLGLYISFAGMLTFKKSDALRSVAAKISRDRLLVETDSPYLAPVPRRGKRNEPSFVQHTARCLAELHDISFEEMAELTTRNARSLFPLPGENG